MVHCRLAARSAAACTALAVGLITPSFVRAQTSMGTPNAVFPEDFGTVQTVRELPDGRVLVADPLGKELYAVDMDAGVRTVIGSLGQGPEEYLQPDAVWALPGDSTLLVDLGNGRNVALDPDLRFGPTSPLATGDPRSSLVLALPQGVDGLGRIYSRSMGGLGGALSDSAAIMRITRGTPGIDTVAMFKLQGRTQTRSGDANNQNVQISPVPLSPEDAWGVAADGSVAVARSVDYHVEWISPDGSMTRGTAISFDAVRIGTAEKEEYLTTQSRNGGGIQVAATINNGAIEMNFSRGGGGNRREIDQYEWPDRKPPFYSGRLNIDVEDRVWVQRHVDAGEPSTYDIFDRRGEHVGAVSFEHGKRVVGFGPTSVYVVRYDDFDLNYLERYDLPST
jgi:hypothetical protein